MIGKKELRMLAVLGSIVLIVEFLFGSVEVHRVAGAQELLPSTASAIQTTYR